MKVSVLLITYNHELFIEQAIQSVLAQKVNSDFEIVIGEDLSTDKTRDILLNYSAQFPDKIRLLSTPTNLGMHKNFVRTYHACSGDYIALLEGDDYWISPDKLQKQIDYLDSHPETTVCAHSVYFVNVNDVNTAKIAGFGSVKKSKYSLSDIASYSFLATGSIMARNFIVDKFPDWYYELAMGDWPFLIMLAQHGDIGFIDEVLGVYRVHNSGYWSGMDAIEKKKKVIHSIDVLNEYLEFKYQRKMKATRCLYLHKISTIYERLADYINAKKYFKQCIKYYPYYSRYHFNIMFRSYFRLYIPGLAKSVRSVKSGFRIGENNNV